LTEFPDSPLAPLTRAHLAIAEGNPLGAREHLAASRQVHGLSAELDGAIGIAALRTESWSEAAAAFRSAIAGSPGMSAAHEGLSQALLALGEYEDAAEAALDAIRLRYDRPAAHHTLGMALQALGREQDAARAFAVSAATRRRTPAA
jgi:tetratricopeptide (TPR) repeat protein